MSTHYRNQLHKLSIQVRPDVTLPNHSLTNWPTDVRGQVIARRPAPALSVSGYMAASLSENSKRAYGCDLRDFELWGGRIPCPPDMVAAYLVSRASTHSMATIARRLVSIGKAHTAQGLLDPTKSELVKRVVRGIKRTHGKPQRKVSPLLREHMTINVLPPGNLARDIRNRAILLVGFAGALRRSEIVALDREHIEVVPEGMLVTLTRSKTDQEGRGQTIAIPYGRTGACPVKALHHWLDTAQIASGAVFRPIRKGGMISGERLTSQTVAVIVKAHARKVGLAEHSYAGHSLRAGLVTSAAQAGVAIHKIQQQSRHASLSMLAEYIRDANLFVDNAAGMLL